MLTQQIKAEIPIAMKAKDQVRLDTLRMLTAAFTNELVATKRKPTDELPDEDAIAVIRREVKKRKEAAEAFKGGGRPEAAAKEHAEEAILSAYLPALMSEDEVMKVVKAKYEEMAKAAKGGSPGAGLDPALRGKLMGMVMKELAGKADGTVVKMIVDKVF